MSEELTKISELLKQFQKQAKEIILFNDFHFGLIFLQRIKKFLSDNENLKQNEPDVYHQVELLKIQVSWISLNTLNKEQIIDLFKNHLSEAFQIQEFDSVKDIFNKLKTHFLGYFLLEDRDDFKKELREAIRDNNQVFFPDASGKGKTIGFLINNYVQIFGAESVEKVKLMEYLTQISNQEKLTAEEKQKRLKLFDLFEKLKLSSFDAVGLEEKLLIKTENQLKSVEQGKEFFLTKERARRSSKVSLESEMLEQAEEEIAKIKREEAALIGPKIDLNQAIANVIKGSQLEFLKKSSPEDAAPDIAFGEVKGGRGQDVFGEKKRFENIIIAFFKEVRTNIETKIVLKREQKIGGMGLDQQTADKIIDILQKEKSNIVEILETESPKETRSPQPQKVDIVPLVDAHKVIQAETKLFKGPSPTTGTGTPPPKPVKPVFPSKPVLPSPSLPPKPVKSQPKVDLAPVIKPVPKPVSPPSVIKPILPPKPVLSPSPPPPSSPPSLPRVELGSGSGIPSVRPQPKDVPPPPLTEKSTFQPIIRPQPAQPTKPRVEEIKIKPRVYGPIEELRTLTLVDWRRWGKTNEAAQKIEDKINLLGEESLVKKAEGIKAWKNSEINKLYLEIGAESIDSNKSVTEIIIQRSQKGLKTLTEEEFNNVVELNQKLRF